MGLEERTSLGSLASQWDALVDRLPLPTPFLRSWWVDNVAVGEPLILCCVEGDRLLGGLALQRSTKFGTEWLELVGDGALEPDHLDIVCDPDHAAEVEGQLVGWMERSGDRVFDLRGLAAHGRLVGRVPGLGRTKQMDVAPFLSLPDTYEALMASLPGKLRSTIKRTGNRLDKAGVTTRFRDPSEIDEALDSLLDLHEDRWGTSSGFVSGWPRFAAAARAGAAAGEVWVTELLAADGAVVASEIDLWAGSRLSFYQAGRLTEHELRGSGSLLKARILERAIQHGATEFDLLRGDEPYKREWASTDRPLTSIRHGRGPRGLALVALAETNQLYQDKVVVPRLHRQAARAEGGGNPIQES